MLKKLNLGRIAWSWALVAIAMSGCQSNPWISWATQGSAQEIWGMRVDGTSRGVYTRNHADGFPTIDHRGQRIIFNRSNGQTWEIWLMDFGGQNPQLLRTVNNQPLIGVGPTWHPDGNRIVFVRGAQQFGLYGDIAVYDLTTRQVSTIASGQRFCEPSVSPDGTKVVFSRDCTFNPPRPELFVANINGTNLTSLGTGRSPAWSPDGGKIAISDYVTASSGTREIFVMNANGTGRQQITSQGACGYPAFSPDGQRIAYTVQALGRMDLWLVNAAGGSPEQLTNTPNVDEIHPTFNGSP